MKKAKRTKKTAGESKVKTKAELFAEHVEKEPASVQRLLHQFDVQLNRQKHEPDIFYIVNESVAGKEQLLAVFLALGNFICILGNR